jgi:uncharacterized protein (UPF0303 family)
MTYTPASLAAEQQTLLLDCFDYDFAWALGVRMRELAVQVAAPVAITVAHGTALVFSTLLPGATLDNLDWTARKRAVSHRFHRASLAVRLEAEAAGHDFNARFRLPEADYVASGGGVPLILRGGTLIGTAAISGLPDVEDHKMVVSALLDLLKDGAR